MFIKEKITEEIHRSKGATIVPRHPVYIVVFLFFFYAYMYIYIYIHIYNYIICIIYNRVYIIYFIII